MKSDFFKTFIKYISIGILSFVIMLNFTSVSFISYADTQSDYDENNRQLDNLKKEQAALSSELGELNSQLETFSDTLNLITERMASKQQEIDILNQDISDMENEKHKQYEAMKLRIQYMYESNEYSFMDVLMDSADMAELLKKADYARQISDYDRSMLSNLNELITTLNQNKISLNNDMTELVLYPQAKKGKYTMPKGIKTADVGIFSNAAGLTELTLSYEKSLSFDGCKALKKVTYSEGVTSVSLFRTNSTAINNIYLPRTLRYISLCGSGRGATVHGYDKTLYYSSDDEYFKTKLDDYVKKYGYKYKSLGKAHGKATV